MLRKLYLVAAVGALAAPALVANNTFIADSVFTGSALTGWHVLGQADWKAANGELVGTPKAGGGWLVMDKSYQDVGVHVYFKCASGCKTGVLLRAEKTASGMKGIFVTVADGRISSSAVTLDAQGKELTRTALDPASSWFRTREQANAGRGGSAPAAGRGAAPGGAGAPAGAAAAGRGAGGPAGAGAPGGAAAGRGAGGPGGAPGGMMGGRGAGPAMPVTAPDTSYKAGEWNELEIILDAGYVRSSLNMGRESAGYADDELGSYGPVALFAGGDGEVRFKEVAYADIAMRKTLIEKTSPNFRAQQISDMYYSWSAAAADFNKDGVMDIAAGPYIYYGPDFVKSREIFTVTALKPSTEFPYAHCQYTFDFNGDGWPDILIGPPDGAALYINPKGESRRWQKSRVIQSIQSEESFIKDVDGDGRPELVVSANQTAGFYKYDPADPTKAWTYKAVSERGYGTAHGVGAGDINGDGRVDILNCYGWWEQPPAGSNAETWTYHPEAFGWYSRSAFGGVGMYVYDVNGDKLNDVVTVMSAHGFGLAWLEQKRDKDGKISFVQHSVMGPEGYGAKSEGNVIISEMHGTAMGDVNGDGIPDFIVGKRYWTHLDSYLDPDPYGPPYLYAYITVRDPKAPGGAKLVPEMIHNRSGAGSDICVADLNKDGALDIVTSTNRGTFIFWGKPRAGAKATAAAKPAAK
jgi:hypothetical protein